MKFLRNNVANFITISRIVFSLVLLDLKLDYVFVIVYSICGVTDVLDGTIARLLKTTSRFGSIIDSISDLIFYSILLLKLWFVLREIIPIVLWIWFYIILVLRAYLYVYVGYNKKHFLSNHTIWNKLTGFSVFLFPYTLFFFKEFAVIHLTEIFTIATIALIQEIKLVEVND